MRRKFSKSDSGLNDLLADHSRGVLDPTAFAQRVDARDQSNIAKTRFRRSSTYEHHVVNIYVDLLQTATDQSMRACEAALATLKSPEKSSPTDPKVSKYIGEIEKKYSGLHASAYLTLIEAKFPNEPACQSPLNRFNAALAQYVTTDVLMTETSREYKVNDLARMAMRVNRWVEIADKMEEKGNFLAATAIRVGVVSNTITRLRGVIDFDKNLSKKSKQLMQQAEEKASSATAYDVKKMAGKNVIHSPTYIVTHLTNERLEAEYELLNAETTPDKEDKITALNSLFQQEASAMQFHQPIGVNHAASKAEKYQYFTTSKQAPSVYHHMASTSVLPARSRAGLSQAESVQLGKAKKSLLAGDKALHQVSTVSPGKLEVERDPSQASYPPKPTQCRNRLFSAKVPKEKVAARRQQTLNFILLCNEKGCLDNKNPVVQQLLEIAEKGDFMRQRTGTELARVLEKIPKKSSVGAPPWSRLRTQLLQANFKELSDQDKEKITDKFLQLLQDIVKDEEYKLRHPSTPEPRSLEYMRDILNALDSPGPSMNNS